MNFPPGIAAALQQNYLSRVFDNTFMAPYRESLPYSWHITSHDDIETTDYRGRAIVTRRDQWVPPEKTRERNRSSIFAGDRTERPDELDENNTAIVYRTPSFDNPNSKRTFDAVDKAKAYIDNELALDAQTESLAPIIAFLKDLPCSCGEYGSIDDREYIRYAAQLAEIVKL